MTQLTYDLLMAQPAFMPGSDLIHWGIVPTIVLPFAMLGVILSMIATFIAGMFGVQLNTAGPRRLLELFFKRRVIVFMILSNLLIWTGIYGFRYFSNLPSPLWLIRLRNGDAPAAVAGNGITREYGDWLGTRNSFPPVASKAGGSGRDLSGMELVWDVKIPAGSFGGLILSGDGIFFGGEDGYLYEHAQEDGALRRSFFVGTSVTPSPVVADSWLYAGEGVHETRRARTYAFDLISGELQGAVAAKGHNEGNPRIVRWDGRKLIVFAAGRDGIVAADAVSMKRLWKYGGGHSDAEVYVEAGVVFAAFGMDKDEGNQGSGPMAVALDLLTGREIWRRDLLASSWHMPVAYRNFVCFGMGELYFPSQAGGVACFDKVTGSTGPFIGLDGPMVTYPLLIGEDLATMDRNGQVCVHELATLRRKWCRAVSKKGSSYATPIYDGAGHLLVASNDQGLVALGLSDGEIRARWQPAKGQTNWTRPSAALALRDGYLYMVDWQGEGLRKIHLLYDVGARLSTSQDEL